jgi:hypothetical protein
MKHILFATTGIALALGFVGTASADVDILATITKDKDITITQRVTINKTIRIDVDVAFVLQGGAEAQALLNVTNRGNDVTGQDVPGGPTTQDEYGLDYDASLLTSVNNNRGVWGVNQDVGNMTNQGNVVSIAGVSDGFEVFAQSQAHADQLNTFNRVREEELLRDLQGNPISDLVNTPASAYATNKSASITNSINTNTGVINVNQNAGNMNNQSNGLAAAIGIGAEFAMSEGDLGQENTNNLVNELETVKVSSISGSINGNTGIVNVNQSTGNMNNQGNVVSLSAILSGSFIDTQAPSAP